MVVAPRTPDRFCTALMLISTQLTTPLPNYYTTQPKPRVPSLVLSSLLCDLSIQPISSRRVQRRRTRPAVIVTIAQPDCDIRSSS